jgi:hypothetical protein
MDINKLIRELHSEKERLDRVIAALEELESVRNSAIPALRLTRRGRKSMGVAERRAVSERMKAYWSKRRKHQST